MTHKPTNPSLKMKNPKVWHVLRRARVLLQTHGWTRGVSERRNAKGGFEYCAVGATHAAHPHLSGKANAILSNIVSQRGFDSSIIGYNDMPGRSKAEVIGVFREAETLAKSRNE